MKRVSSWIGVFVLGSILISLPAAAQNATAPAASAIPRMPDGRADLSGVWEAPFVNDMSKNGKNQQGAGPLPYTEWAKAHLGDTDRLAGALPASRLHPSAQRAVSD